MKFTILDRYFFREFIKVYLGTVILLTGVSVIAKFMERAKSLLSYNQDDQGWRIFQFLIMNVPNMVMIVSPSSLLVAISFTVANFTRYNELSVVMAAGRSFKRIMAPIMIFSVLFAVFSLWFNEHLAFPNYYNSRNLLWHMEKRDVERYRANYRSNFNLKSGNSYFHIGNFKPVEKEAENIHVLQLRDNLTLMRIVEAENAKIIPGKWQLRNAVISTFDSHGKFEKQERKKEMEFPFKEGTEYFTDIYMAFEEMSIYDVAERLKLARITGENHLPLEVEFYWHLGYPLVSIFIVFLGSMFGIKLKKGALAGSIAISVVISMFYYIIMYFGKSLGSIGSVHPLIAGNFANIVFFIFCVILWLRSKD